jgi:ribose 5-phosphate isomerase B
MRIALGADHRGTELAKRILERLQKKGVEARVVGGLCADSSDYPDKAFAVATEVASGRADLGVLLCGTGIGMCMAANKVKGVRAAPAHDEFSAEMSRRHNDANVLCLSADLLGANLIDRIIDAWLATDFEGGRHARRVRKIKAIEEGRDPATVRE